MAVFGLAMLLISSFPGYADVNDGYATWDDRCEECHGDADEFARKYMWLIDGQLQGRHHIDDLHLFLAKHYIPAYRIDAVSEMLQANANTLVRFGDECGSCHGSPQEFVHKSIASRISGLAGVESGLPVEEFLPTHQGMSEADAEFYTRLIIRVSEQITGSPD